MARIFTLDFQFRGTNHAAVVSTWKGDRHLDYFQIALYDETLQHLVPEGIIRFNVTEDSAVQTDAGRAELVHCLKKAVTGYIQQVPLT